MDFYNKSQTMYIQNGVITYMCNKWCKVNCNMYNISTGVTAQNKELVESRTPIQDKTLKGEWEININ